MAQRGGSKEKKETSLGDALGGSEDASEGKVVHEVGEVFVYIPPELSAAGVELKIVGAVRVADKVRGWWLG